MIDKNISEENKFYLNMSKVTNESVLEENIILRNALREVKYGAVSLADAQVIALDALGFYDIINPECVAFLENLRSKKKFHK